MFFVKYPIPDKVKTRLAKQIGADASAGLYRNFVTDILATLQRLNVNFKIIFDPPDRKDQFQQWLGKDCSYLPQAGLDLGQRMKNAFLQAFSEGFGHVVVIGSDSPDLPIEYLGLAFHALDMNDVVIGPSSDGGYYLIGFTREAFLAEAFEQISWSSNKVFDQTINILKRYRQNLYLLPQWYDVDTLVDMDELIERNRNTAFNQSESFALVHKIKNQMIV